MQGPTNYNDKEHEIVSGAVADELVQLKDQVRALSMRVQLLLQNVGNRGTCKGCGREIWWVTHNNGKAVPYTGTGLNHFIDCPKAQEFRKKEEKDAKG